MRLPFSRKRSAESAGTDARISSTDPEPRAPEGKPATVQSNDVVTIPSLTTPADSKKIARHRPEIQSLVRELIEIGNTRGFVTSESNDKRTRKIGSRLNAIAGMDLMERVYDEVATHVRRPARELDLAWDGIGEWRG